MADQSLLVLTIVIILSGMGAANSSSPLPRFIPQNLRKFSNGTNFTNILLHEKSVYIGARDFLFKLDAGNIENTNSQHFGFVNLPANQDQKEQCIVTYYDEVLCNNYIKSILYRRNDNDLYVCGSYAFTPRLYQISFDLSVIKEDDGYGYCSLNPLDTSTSIWIEQGNPLNIASIYSGALLDASTKTQPVEPVIYRPELKRNDKAYPYLRTPKFDSDWLYQPSFVASFDVDDYVLFFLKEKSVEQVAESQDVFYSRVIRVCKNDAGSIGLGNQWSSMRKARITCQMNNTYLNQLDDMIRISEDTFIGLFSLKMASYSVSVLCEFKKQALLSTLNSNMFKEVLPGTQYWSKMTSEKIPKSLPSQCDYNSQNLKDDVANFMKSHPLVADQIEGTVLYHTNKPVSRIAVDTIKTPDQVKMNVFYLGTSDGMIVKLVDTLTGASLNEISEWKICDEPIEEIEIRAGHSAYIATSVSVYQMPLYQCSKYVLCSSCMSDPYCGWNIRKNICEDNRVNTNLISMNANLCSRFHNKKDSVRVIDADADMDVLLDCRVSDERLKAFVEWRRDKMPVDAIINRNLVVTIDRDLLIVNGNSSLSGLYNCVIDGEIINSYSVNFKQNSQMVSAANQKCITAESYIRQYNNWCDEFSRYQRALNEWEELKDKTCGRN